MSNGQGGLISFAGDIVRRGTVVVGLEQDKHKTQTLDMKFRGSFRFYGVYCQNQVGSSSET